MFGLILTRTRLVDIVRCEGGGGHHPAGTPRPRDRRDRVRRRPAASRLCSRPATGCAAWRARRASSRAAVGGQPGVEIVVQADLADAGSPAAAMRGCGAAYYLVHSMVSTGAATRSTDRRHGAEFARRPTRPDSAGSSISAAWARRAAGLSEHLASRREVEAVLARAACRSRSSARR